MATSEPEDSVTKAMITAVPPTTAMAPVPMPTSAISRSISLRYRVTAHAMSRPPITANQPSLPAWSSGRATASRKRRRSSAARGKRARTTWAVVMSVRRSEPHTDGRQHDVDRVQRDHAQHHGLVDGGAQTLGTAAHGQAPVTADQPSDHSKRGGLGRRDDHFRQPRDQGQGRKVGATRHVLQVYAEDDATDQADHAHEAVEQR